MIATTIAATDVTTTVTTRPADSVQLTTSGRAAHAGAAHRGIPTVVATVAAATGPGPADLPTLPFLA